MLQALLLSVADGGQAAIRETAKISNEERSPIAATDHSDPGRLAWTLAIICLHIFRGRAAGEVAGLGGRAVNDWRHCEAIAGSVFAMIQRSSQSDMLRA